MDITVLVVEDEPAVQELIAVTLERAGFVGLVAEDANEARLHIKTELPNLILLDWMLPNMSGIEFAKQLRQNERTSLIPIIMLTAKTTENDKVAGLDAGADDYITKPFSPRELISRIKAVLRRQIPQISEETITVNHLSLNPVTHQVLVKDHHIVLGPTEFKLLHFLMTHQERVYSRSKLLDNIWGDHVFIEERTVDVHIRRLRAALEPYEHDNLIQTVRGNGYRLSKK